MSKIKTNEESNSIAFINSTVNEVYSITEVKQIYINNYRGNMELSIRFPIVEKIQLNKFVVSKDNEKVISKVMDKEKAVEKYSDTIASGNTGIISEYKKEQNQLYYDVNIGNILPNEKIELISYFYQLISSDDMSYEYCLLQNLPAFSKKYTLRKITGKITINTESKITRLIFPFLNDEKTKITSKTYSNNGKTCTIEFDTNPIKTKTKQKKDIMDNEDLSKRKRYYWRDNIIPKGFIRQREYGKEEQDTLRILFRTDNINNPILYAQYNPQKKQTAYSLNFIYSSNEIKNKIIPSKDDTPVDEDNDISYYQSLQSSEVNDTPGCFIFLIDQSGSMSGKPINLVKEALILFLHSLNEGSYFQLIGFGSNYIKHNKIPLEYNQTNVEKTLKIVESLKASLGGTNIYDPLKYIFNNKKDYNNIHLSKNIFLLTDGEVMDRDNCIELIKKSSGEFRIHSIGVGNSFDKILIEQSGKYGRGSVNFVKEIEELNKSVINSLNMASRKYLVNSKFENSLKYLYECQPSDDFAYQDDIVNYSFIIEGQPKNENINIVFKSNDAKKDITENLAFKSVKKIEDGDALSQIIIGNIFNNKKQNLNDNEKIKLSKEYQVLCDKTALYCEIQNSNSSENGKLISIKLNQSNKNDKLYQYNITKRRDYGMYGMLNKKCKAKYNRRESRSRSRSSSSSRENKARKRSRDNYKKFDEFEDEDEDEMGNYSCDKKELFDSELNESQKIIDKTKTSCGNVVQKDDININNIIGTQDIMLGFWKENKFTKVIAEKNKNIFNKISSFVNGNDSLKDKKTIIYTILVIYYLLNIRKDKLEEMKMIISKGKKYLNNQGCNYDSIKL